MCNNGNLYYLILNKIKNKKWIKTKNINIYLGYNNNKYTLTNYLNYIILIKLNFFEIYTINLKNNNFNLNKIKINNKINIKNDYLDYIFTQIIKHEYLLILIKNQPNYYIINMNSRIL